MFIGFLFLLHLFLFSENEDFILPSDALQELLEDIALNEEYVYNYYHKCGFTLMQFKFIYWCEAKSNRPTNIDYVYHISKLLPPCSFFIPLLAMPYLL